jgi:Glycosyl transferase family 8
MKNRGVIYCAVANNLYLQAALISAIALRQLEPEIPITIISDLPLLKILPLSDYRIALNFIESNITCDNSYFSSRDIKTRLSTFSPYEETLFLDADVLPLMPIAPIWDYLSDTDLAMVVDRTPTVSLCDHISQAEKKYTLQFLPGSTTQFNSGVILWRDNLQTQTLFQQWHEEWRQFQKHDQLALVRAIHSTHAFVASLPQIYNIVPYDAEPLLSQKHDVSLLHCCGGLVLSGEYLQIAQRFYPQIVDYVTKISACLS